MLCFENSLRDACVLKIWSSGYDSVRKPWDLWEVRFFALRGEIPHHSSTTHTHQYTRHKTSSIQWDRCINPHIETSSPVSQSEPFLFLSWSSQMSVIVMEPKAWCYFSSNFKYPVPYSTPHCITKVMFTTDSYYLVCIRTFCEIHTTAKPHISQNELSLLITYAYILGRTPTF